MGRQDCDIQCTEQAHVCCDEGDDLNKKFKLHIL